MLTLYHYPGVDLPPTAPRVSLKFEYYFFVYRYILRLGQ